MTIQDLYDWAKEKNYLDVTIAKHCNGEVFDVERTVVLLAEEWDLPATRVILD